MYHGLNYRILPALLIDSWTDDHGDLADLVLAINTFEPGEIIDVEYASEGQQETIPVTLGYRVKKEMTWEACCIEAVTENNLEITNADIQSNDLEIYPNPNDGLFNLQFSSSDLSEADLYITDVAGRVIFRKTINDFDGYYNRMIDISREANGLYFLNVVQNEEVLTKKIVLHKE